MAFAYCSTGGLFHIKFYLPSWQHRILYLFIGLIFGNSAPPLSCCERYSATVPHQIRCHTVHPSAKPICCHTPKRQTKSVDTHSRAKSNLLPHTTRPLVPIHVSVSKIGGPIVEIYKSLTDTWMWKLGTRLHSFISGNICFEFPVQCICSVCCSAKAKMEMSRDVDNQDWEETEENYPLR
jgi:hypothetical protein